MLGRQIIKVLFSGSGACGQGWRSDELTGHSACSPVAKWTGRLLPAMRPEKPIRGLTILNIKLATLPS